MVQQGRAAGEDRTSEGSPAADAAGPAEEGRSRLGGAVDAAAWGFVFLVLRVFAVSGYDWGTAFAVSTTLGLDDGLGLLFGSLMAGHVLTATLLVLVLPLLLAAQLWGPRQRRPLVVLVTAVGVVVLLALTVSFHSWWLPGATAGVFALLALVRRLPDQSRVRRFTVLVLARVSWVAGVAALVAAAFVSTPWVPHEQIETVDGPVSGYVLSVDSGYLNVLTDDHTFVILLSSDVRSRR